MMGVIFVIMILVLLILVLKMTKKVSHNMILMSRYMGQLHGGRGPKISGNAQKKSFFFCEVFPNNA